MNKANFYGRIANELDIKRTNNGTTYLHFSVAVKDSKDKTDFFNFVAFGKQAETIYTYFRKGSRIVIAARATVESWTDKEGNKRSSVSFVVESFDFVETKAEADRISATEPEQKVDGKDDFMSIPDDALDEVPFK